MSIQFDWHFDDEGNEKTPSVLSSWEPEKEATNTTQSSRIASSAMYIHARSGHHFHPAWLTASQRRLHAALARTRPWLCPDAQPESAAHSFDRWKQGGNIIRSLRIASLLRCFYARLKHRFHQMRLSSTTSLCHSEERSDEESRFATANPQPGTRFFAPYGRSE